MGEHHEGQLRPRKDEPGGSAPRGVQVVQLDRLPLGVQCLLAVVCSALTVAVAVQTEQPLLTGLLATAWTALLLCRRHYDDVLPDRSTRTGFRRVRGKAMTWPQRIAAAILTAPLLTLITLGLLALGRLIWRESPFTAIAIGVALVTAVVVAALQYYAANRINRLVVGDPEVREPEGPTAAKGQRSKATGGPIPEHVPSLPAPRPAAALSFRTVGLDELPSASSESCSAVGIEMTRGQRVRKLYFQHVLALATGTVLLSLLHGDRIEFVKAMATVHGILLGGYYLLRQTLLANVLGAAAAAVRQFASSRVRPDFPQHASHYQPLRPKRLPLYGFAWAITACTTASAIHSSSDPLPWLSCLLLLLPIASAILLFVQRRRLQREQPVFEPYNLLGLRVFGTPYLDEFGVVASGWNRIGNWLQLDGPDTIGTKARDWLNVLLGRTADSIVEDEQELREEFARFDMSRDASLRCRDHSMQCNDATWRQAVERLLEMADVVVMDLSGLSANDRGCAHEISRLFEVMPLAKVMFVIDDATDRTTLQEVFQIARDARTDASCNLDFEGPLELYRAVHLEPGNDLRAPSFGRAVIEALRDRAMVRRPPRHQKPQPRWTATGWPRPLSLLALVGLACAIATIGSTVLS